MKYRQGDILKHERDGERKIIGVCGGVYFVSMSGFEFHDRYGFTTDEKLLDESGYEFMRPEEYKARLEMLGSMRTDNKKYENV
jgi:hypothetical protein